jgi:hypothetical protein
MGSPGIREPFYMSSSWYAALLHLVIDLVRRMQDIGVKQVISEPTEWVVSQVSLPLRLPIPVQPVSGGFPY